MQPHASPPLPPTHGDTPSPRTSFRGLCWHVRNRRWEVRIRIKTKQVALGSYADEGTAARVYDSALRYLRGAFATKYLNFPAELPAPPSELLLPRLNAALATLTCAGDTAVIGQGQDDAAAHPALKCDRLDCLALALPRSLTSSASSELNNCYSSIQGDLSEGQYAAVEALAMAGGLKYEAEQVEREAAAGAASAAPAKPRSAGPMYSSRSAGAKARQTMFRGICWHTWNRKWEARTRHKGKQIALGCYSTEEEAARVYDAAVFFLHKRDARLNFSDYPGGVPPPPSVKLLARLKGARPPPAEQPSTARSPAVQQAGSPVDLDTASAAQSNAGALVQLPPMGMVNLPHGESMVNLPHSDGVVNLSHGGGAFGDVAAHLVQQGHHVVLLSLPPEQLQLLQHERLKEQQMQQLLHDRYLQEQRLQQLLQEQQLQQGQLQQLQQLQVLLKKQYQHQQQGLEAQRLLPSMQPASTLVQPEVMQGMYVVRHEQPKMAYYNATMVRLPDGNVVRLVDVLPSITRD